MNFFTQLFNQLSSIDSLLILLFLFIAFLIGLITAWLIFARKVSRLEGVIRDHERTIEALNKKNAKLKEQIELKEADLAKANLEIENLRVRLRHLETEKGQMHGELYASKEAIQILEGEKRNLSDELNTSRAAQKGVVGAGIVAGGAKDGKLKDKLSKAQERLNSMQAQIESLNATRSNLETEVARLNNELEATKTDLRESYGTSNSLKARRQELSELVEQLEQEKSELEERLGVQEQKEESPEANAGRARSLIREALGATIPKATAADADDLKKINGIGPFIEQKLNNLGIYTYEQISHFDQAFIQTITDAIQFFPGRIERDDWVGQAKQLLGEKT